MTRVDLSVLPADLAALYGGVVPDLERTEARSDLGAHQLVLPVEPAEHEFRRWLLEQPQPSFITERRDV